MAIAKTLKHYLDEHQIAYQVIRHPPAYTAMRSAEAAHCSGENLAKAVVVGDGQAYRMVVVPATHKVALDRIPVAGQARSRLAREVEFGHLFADCEIGAIPAPGDAYGVPTLVDDALLARDEICFEGGNHEDLVRVSGADFRGLMRDAEHGAFSRHR